MYASINIITFIISSMPDTKKATIVKSLCITKLRQHQLL